MREYGPPGQTIQVVLVILSKVSWIRLEPLNVIVWLNYKVHISYIMLNLLQIFMLVLKEINLKQSYRSNYLFIRKRKIIAKTSYRLLICQH